MDSFKGLEEIYISIRANSILPFSKASIDHRSTLKRLVLHTRLEYLESWNLPLVPDGVLDCLGVSVPPDLLVWYALLLLFLFLFSCLLFYWELF
jgi:hypothetical protein